VNEPQTPTPRERALSFLTHLKALELRIAAGALVVMMMVTVADVFLRYVFNNPIRGSYDLVECSLAVFVFHGMAAAFLDRKNIVIDVLDHFVPERPLVVLIRISDVLSIACLLLVAWAMTTPALQAFNYGDRKIDLNLPIWWLWAAAFAGMAATILCALGATLIRPKVDKEHAV
jgi:TRAP-type C4-dicarboxylate transport system permease small subunit